MVNLITAHRLSLPLYRSMQEPETSITNRSTSRLLWGVKLAAILLSLLYALPNLPIVGDLDLNFVSVTFYISLLGLIPRFGWTIPTLVLGFWLTPMIFAFRVNGSFAEDLTACIIGGSIGLVVGLIIDLQLHKTNAPLPDTPNAG